jgi:uncharacterized protein with PIN domain
MTKKKTGDIAAEARLAAAEREAEVVAVEMAQKAVAWQAAHPRATMEEMEEALLQLRAEFSQQLARVLLEHREATQPVPGPRCPQCGQEMQYKGDKSLHPPTTLGDVAFERGYYYCSECDQGVFPPGSGVTPDPEGA